MPNINIARILYQFFDRKALEHREYQDTPDIILISMIHHAMQDDSFLPEAARYLQPLVPRIMAIDALATSYISFNPDIIRGDALFEGNKRFGFGTSNAPAPCSLFKDISHVNDYYLNHGEFGVARLLFQLHVKSESLKQRKETIAYEKAHELHNTLRFAFLNYLNSNKGENAREALNTTWTQAINAAKSELEKHRSWSNFLINLLLVIPTLGAFMFYAGYKSKGKNFLFPFVDTDSANHIKKLEQIDKYEFTTPIA